MKYISCFQEKLEKSHKELRVVLEENKTLKKRLENGDKTHEETQDIDKHSKMMNGDHSPSTPRNEVGYIRIMWGLLVI